jgi:glycosyltransferase involved in cell wall biosynthesis
MQSLPKIGVVIIGINESGHLADCIRSIKSSRYPQYLLEIVFVDGGSKDNSPEIARGFKDVTVIELEDPHPTPGRGRNAGWRSLSAPVIQFIDADMVLCPDWLLKAATGLDDHITAVRGHLRETSPDKNFFHIIADIEWGSDVGPCSSFGGGVLIKREALEKTGGYDENLIAGEDPELSYRIRDKGWGIQHLNMEMANHDINMNSVTAYLRRSFRSGYAYAEISLRFINNKEKLWLKELTRIVLRTLVPIIAIVVGIWKPDAWLFAVIGLLILLKPLINIPGYKNDKNLSWASSVFYALHTILVIYPQFCGAFRYYWGTLTGNPMVNKLPKG